KTRLATALHGAHPGINSKDTADSNVQATNAELLARTSAPSPDSIAFIKPTRQIMPLTKAAEPSIAIIVICGLRVRGRRTSPAREVRLHTSRSGGRKKLLVSHGQLPCPLGNSFFHDARRRHRKSSRIAGANVKQLKVE